MKTPALFIGHGSPMNIVGDNAYTRFLRAEGASLARPKAILVVSAHWETRGTKVLKVEKPRTIHDFSGFPRKLYEVTYPAAGSPETAAKVLDLVASAHADDTWGLDHGTWAVLHHMFPDADVPVLQLSLDRNLAPREHWDLAKSLRPLRDDGVLIIGSGNITHNLGDMDWSSEDAKPFQWAEEFDAMVKDALANDRVDELLTPKAGTESLWRRAHPRLDHWLPILYTLGVRDPSEAPAFPFEGMQHGSLSMRAVKYGA